MLVLLRFSSVRLLRSLTSRPQRIMILVVLVRRLSTRNRASWGTVLFPIGRWTPTVALVRMTIRRLRRAAVV